MENFYEFFNEYDELSGYALTVIDSDIDNYNYSGKAKYISQHRLIAFYEKGYYKLLDEEYDRELKRMIEL